MKVEIMACTRQRYGEFLDLLDLSFGNGANWFTNCMEHVLPVPEKASDREIALNKIAVADGQVAGALGVYPIDWAVGDGKSKKILKVGGVGQVCCRPDYRNKGIMSMLIKSAISDMSREGYDLSWLHGDRMRYRNYGWELSGGKLIACFKENRLEAPPQSLLTRKAHLDDWNLVNSLYETLPSFVIRGEIMWRRHLQRSSASVEIGFLAGKAAYMAYYKREPRIVREIAGDPNCAMAMIIRHAKAHGQIEAWLPVDQNDLNKKLFAAASDYRLAPLCNLKVISPEKLYEKLLPFLKNQAGEAGAAAFPSPNAQQKERICAALLGFQFNPEIPEGFEYLKPLVFWLPELDEV
ncbi:MAG: GNAT family N-acetyltransferase [Clostridiales bacterium]|jgi:predicted N-acetyltransferase YhbS|nr:GNAT family N-acetyltransferase [Clostridiales bacterium]